MFTLLIISQAREKDWFVLIKNKIYGIHDSCIPFIEMHLVKLDALLVYCTPCVCRAIFNSVLSLNVFDFVEKYSSFCMCVSSPFLVLHNQTNKHTLKLRRNPFQPRCSFVFIKQIVYNVYTMRLSSNISYITNIHNDLSMII